VQNITNGSIFLPLADAPERFASKEAPMPKVISSFVKNVIT
jgi:hypothetical protein